MKKWLVVPIIAGVITAGGVAIASDSQPPTTIDKEKNIISLQQAKELATQTVGGGIVKEIELEKERSGYAYEAEVVANGIEYELKVDARTQEVQIIDQSKKAVQETKTSEQFISKAEATEIAKEKAPNASIKEIELGKDDNRKVYEVEMKDSKYEYELEIDAKTGKGYRQEFCVM